MGISTESGSPKSEVLPGGDNRSIRFQGTSKMLRITVTENESEQRWVLQGRLTGSFLEELTTSWRANRDRQPAQNRVVDLNQITGIDKDGEQVLLMMIKDGAKFVASGLYTKHLLESLSGHIAKG